ncbi:MAG: hypothetical protein GVY22_16175 [Gammaproteobacteria bacterium]|jgi:hypothetical protein|nr:hypothetical protein [Gammaproteobacteria bacterium]
MTSIQQTAIDPETRTPCRHYWLVLWAAIPSLSFAQPSALESSAHEPALKAVQEVALAAAALGTAQEPAQPDAQPGVVELQRTAPPTVVERKREQVQAGVSDEAVATETQESPVQVETRAEESSRIRATPDETAAQSARAAAEPEPARFYSAGRRAEPQLWMLLNADRYQELQREITRLQQLDPRWQPPPELLYWLRHHLAEQADVDARNGETRDRATTTVSPYSAALRRAGRLQAQDRAGDALRALDPWLAQITSRHDANAMVLIGWLRLDTQDAQAALRAFEQSYQWRASADAAKGELLALARLDDNDRLLRQAKLQAERWPMLHPTAAASLRSAATRLHQASRYQQAQHLLDAALELAPAGRDIEILTGWNLLRLGKGQAAAETFEQLYRRNPDSASAEGLLSSLRQQGADTKLERLAQAPGPLRQLWLADQVERFVERGEPLRAYRTDPEGLPALANLDSPAVGLGLSWRERSGDPGLGQLTETRIPIVQYTHWTGLLGVGLSIDRVMLDAGTARADALIGSAPGPMTPSKRRATSDASHVDNGLTWTLGLSYQGDWRLAAQVGQTPTDGALDATLHGRLGVGRRGSDFAWNATLAHEPVRESLLSYTGMTDPGNGGAWGRVFRSGLTLDAWYQIDPKWTLSSRLQVHEYQGRDVADNTGIAASLSIGRNLPLSGFAYLTLGPAVEYQHFRRNLNHFTLGHGGYYSPEQDLGLMLALDFQTREAAPWLVQGSARAGWRSQEEAESPWFPLGTTHQQDRPQRYAASSESGLAASLRLEGAAQLSRQWQIGAALSGNYSLRFEEYKGMLFLRWLFEPRNAVFSSDLPSAAIANSHR